MFARLGVFLTTPFVTKLLLCNLDKNKNAAHSFICQFYCSWYKHTYNNFIVNYKSHCFCWDTGINNLKHSTNWIDSMAASPANTEGPLLVINLVAPYEVEQHPNPLLDFLSVNWLGHLSGPVSITPEFICRVCSLLARLALPKSKVRCHYDPIYSPLVNQR